MIKAPICWERHCRFYIGIKSDDECELNERTYCHYYPDGIPDGIILEEVECEYYKNKMGAEPDPEDEPDEEAQL